MGAGRFCGNCLFKCSAVFSMEHTHSHLQQSPQSDQGLNVAQHSPHNSCDCRHQDLWHVLIPICLCQIENNYGCFGKYKGNGFYPPYWPNGQISPTQPRPSCNVQSQSWRSNKVASSQSGYTFTLATQVQSRFEWVLRMGMCWQHSTHGFSCCSNIWSPCSQRIIMTWDSQGPHNT